MAEEIYEVGADSEIADSPITENEPEAIPEDPTIAQSGEAEGEAEKTREVDFAELVREDMRELAAEFPEMRDVSDIMELKEPLRYAALRDLGLSPREAYLATEGRKRAPDTRRHLTSAVPKAAGAPGSGMSLGELEKARDLFPGLGDRELMGLYKRVRA